LEQQAEDKVVKRWLTVLVFQLFSLPLCRPLLLRLLPINALRRVWPPVAAAAQDDPHFHSHHPNSNSSSNNKDVVLQQVVLAEELK
jgi:hypothetical protein